MPKNNTKVIKVKTNINLETLKLKTPTFLESITTLHGINHFTVKKGKSLFLWTLAMICHIILTIAFLMIIKGRYNSDQIVTKIYSDRSVDKVPFPAISICNFNMVSANESKVIRNILLKNKIPEEEIEKFFFDLFYLVDFGVGSDNAVNHSMIMNILKIHYYSMDIIMEEVHQKCKNLLLYCEFNDKQKDCENVFSLIKTYAGFCCTFNFNGIDDDDVDPTLLQDDDFEYYYDESPDGEQIPTKIVATSQSGSSSGLRVVFNVEPNDYGDWTSMPAYGAKILFNDPNDYVETRVIYRYISLGESMDVKVEPMMFDCEDSLRYIDIEKRGCWFHDEVKLVNTKRYSYETCGMECKMQSFKDYCGCVPFKYPHGKETRICEFTDIKCLHYMKVYWEATKTPCDPICYKECRDKWYSVVTDTVPFLSESYPQDIMIGRNVSELAALRVYYIQSTCNAYMMTLVTDTNTFIATYGGIFSLCFGASIITLCELVYLCMASFAKTVWKNVLGNKIYF